MTQHTVIRAHRASYQDPIRCREGDELELTGREDIWDGHRWLWALHGSGREGWVPDDLPIRCRERLIAAHDYDAKEMTVEVGESVHVDATRHGWCLCRGADGAQGWVPARSLARPGGPS